MNANKNAKLIIKTVMNVSLNTLLCRSKTYDGTANMSEKQKVISNKLCDITGNKKTVHSHCASHKLNLWLSKASKVPRFIFQIFGEPSKNS